MDNSKNIGWYEAGEYLVSAASWKNVLDGIQYEIGIREKKTSKFWLMQSDWNHQTVQEVANAVAKLLGDLTEPYTPEWCMEHFK